MAVVKDIVEAHRVKHGSNGLEAVRVFMVNELNGDAWDKLHQVLQLNDIPKRGEFHPSIVGIQADEISADAIDSDIARVVVNYKQLSTENAPPDENQPAQIRIGATVQSKSTTKNVFGDDIVLKHSYSEIDEERNLVTRTVEQGGEVEIQVACMTITCVRREPISPESKAKVFLNRVSQEGWRGDPAGTWLCTRLDGESPDGGLSYMVTYEFQRAEGGWHPTAVFIDPDTDAPPKGLVDGEGIQTVESYFEADFNILGLPLPQ